MSDDTRRLTDPYPFDPDESVTYVTPGGDGSDAVATGARFKNIYGRMLLHRPNDLYVCELDDGAGLQDLTRTHLLAARFSFDDAD